MPSEMPPPPPPPPPRASRLARVETIEEMDNACCLCTSARLRISSRSFLASASCCASRERWCSSKIARSCASPTPAELASSCFANRSSRAHTSSVLLSPPHEPPPGRLDGIKTAPRLQRRRRGGTVGCPGSLFRDTPTPVGFTLARRPVPTMEGRSLNPIAAASPERTVRPPFASMSHEDRDDTAVVVRRRGGSFSTMRGALDQRSWVILGGETDETATEGWGGGSVDTWGGECRSLSVEKSKCAQSAGTVSATCAPSRTWPHRLRPCSSDDSAAPDAAEAQAGVFFALVQRVSGK